MPRISNLPGIEPSPSAWNYSATVAHYLLYWWWCMNKEAKNGTLMEHINALEREHTMLQKTLLRMLSDQSKELKVVKAKYTEKKQI